MTTCMNLEGIILTKWNRSGRGRQILYGLNLCMESNEQNEQILIGDGRSSGGKQMGENGQKVHTSSYEISELWRCHV